MDLNKKRKTSVKMEKETGSDEISALLDEVNSEQEDDVDLMNDSCIKLLLEEMSYILMMNH